jgi:hypothetical protein
MKTLREAHPRTRIVHATLPDSERGRGDSIRIGWARIDHLRYPLVDPFHSRGQVGFGFEFITYESAPFIVIDIFHEIPVATLESRSAIHALHIVEELGIVGRGRRGCNPN